MKKFTMKDINLSEANRTISRNHVDRMKELIRKHGYLNSFPIIVNEEGLIIDGQHRYLACKELGIEPPIVQEKSFDITPIINSTQLKWSTKDYVKYYAAKGYEDYMILEQICKNKNISPGVAYNIIFGKCTNKTGLANLKGISSPLKEGTMKLPDTSDKGLAKLERKIDMILVLINKLNLPKTDRLIIALSRIFNDKNFVYSTMLKKLDYQMARVYRCSTINEYLQMLANIYNHKNLKKITV